MVDKSIHNNPRDPVEAQVVDISCNMNLLIANRASKIRLFKNDGGSNLEINSEGKLGDQEDPGNESWK